MPPDSIPPVPPPHPSRKNYLVFVTLGIFILLLVSLYFNYSSNSGINSTQKRISDLESNISQHQTTISDLQLANDYLKEESNLLQTQNDDYLKRLNELENPPYFTNYLPVQYRFGKPQKIGQTFTVTKNTNVAKIALKGSYGVGGNIIISIYEFPGPQNIKLAAAIAKGFFPATEIVKGKEFEVTLAKPANLVPGQEYFLVAEPEGTKTQAGIAFAEKDIYPDGKMYEFTRMIGGNGEILDTNHSWQPKNSYDVVFTLISGN
jgi:regulator of replication initiation timing